MGTANFVRLINLNTAVGNFHCLKQSIKVSAKCTECDIRNMSNLLVKLCVFPFEHEHTSLLYHSVNGKCVLTSGKALKAAVGLGGRGVRLSSNLVNEPMAVRQFL